LVWIGFSIQDTMSMKKRPIILILLLFVLLGATFYFAYLLFRPKKNQNELTLYGNVDVRLVDISFRVAGQVSELFFEEGDFVKKGELIAKLDINPYDSEVSQAVSRLDALELDLLNARALLDRRIELIKVGGVSKEDLDNSQTSYEQLIANVAGAKASLAIALDSLSYTEAYAPTDGIILTRIREPGTVVRESDPVVTLSVASPVWIRAFVSEPDLGAVYYGMPAEIYTDIKKGMVYEGKVGFISPISEFTPKSVETTDLRTDLVYRIRVYADNPDRYLIQGMPVTIKLKLQKRN
jgi:HlyD family secretion protein